MKDVITFDELMKELEKHRGSVNFKSELTKEQKEFLFACRNKQRVVPYWKMAELWEQTGWGKISYITLRSRWLKLKNTNI